MTDEDVTPPQTAEEHVTPERKFVEDIAPGDMVEQPFLVQAKQLRTQRNGAFFLDLELADRTGVVPSKCWDATPELFESFAENDFILVRAHGETYRRRLQLVVTDLKLIDAGEVNVAEFLPATKKDVAELAARLHELADAIENPHLNALLGAFLDDEAFLASFQQAPAAVAIHHAWLGGLLEHTVAVAELAVVVAGRYPNLNGDLLVAGAILHDIGKIDQFDYSRSFRYTDAGGLIGHLPMGMRMVEERAAQLDEFPSELLDQLSHMILSHHGQYEYGSPILPATAEALALHYLDNLDAKLVAFDQALLRDQDPQTNWTEWDRIFDRRLFKKRV